MRVLVLTILVSTSVAGCGTAPNETTQAEKTKQAILRVLHQDEQVAAKREHLPPGSTPAQIGWAIGQYGTDLERLDMADCPADFRVAYRQHLRAWRDTQAAVQQLPDSFLEGLFVGFFNGLLRGERDGGTGRLEGDLKRAIERVRTTWEEVEKIGAKYGAAL